MKPTEQESEKEIFSIGTLPTLTEYQAHCFEGSKTKWELVSNVVQNPRIKEPLAKILEPYGLARVHMTKSGKDSNRVVGSEFFPTKQDVMLPSGVIFRRNPEDAADLVWLNRKEGLIDLPRLQMQVIARAKGFFLAGRYTSATARLIAEAFEAKCVDPKLISITCCFGIKSDDKMTTFDRFKRECADVDIVKVSHPYPIPDDGPFPHPRHSDPTVQPQQPLSVIARLS